MIAGNTVVFKPSTDTPFIGMRLYEILHRSGIPVGVFNFVSGDGTEVGQELADNDDVDGMAFTGSREVGQSILGQFARNRPRPCICEMGGKNPCIVMPTANIDDAAEGVMRAAFGMGGQKCSACCRVYVHESAAKTFTEALLAKTASIKIGDPTERQTFLGPLINAKAVEKFERGVKLGKKDGTLIAGGKLLKSQPGFFVEPTVIADIQPKSK